MRLYADNDNNLLAAEGMIITARCTDRHTILPSSVDGMELNRIGKNSIICMPGTESITFPDSIKEVITGAFSNVKPNGHLRVSLPASAKFDEPINHRIQYEFRAALSESEYRQLSECTLPLAHGYLLMTRAAARMPAFAFMNNQYNVSYNLNRLFDGPLPVFIEGDRGSILFDRYPMLDPRRVKLTEDELIQEMIKSGEFNTLSTEEDAEEDGKLRRMNEGNHPATASIYDCAFMYIMDPPLREGSLYRTVIRVRQEKIFRPLLAPVMYEGKRYYIYFRYYIMMQFRTRQPVCVYADDGLVTNRALSEVIYAKYRFASLL